ncbi:MAG: hypothetical protein R3336_07355, partial [Phycisphaeraceae bacterium]|nr:hypothetical protein [Phycisphaeraceae bacterium]
EADFNVEAPVFGGGPHVSIDASDLSSAQLAHALPVDGSARVEAEVESLAGQLAEGLQSAMKEPMKRVDRFVDAFDKLSGEWTAVGSNVRQLTENVGPDDVDNGDAVASIGSVVARADQRLKEMDQVLAGIDQWVNDEKMQGDARVAVAEARKLATRYAALADELSAATGSMRTLLSQAERGEGTVGKLFKDPAVYDNLEDASARISTVLREMKLLILKWKAEGLPVQF